MDWGKRLRLTFDSTVYHISSVELSRWALKNIYEEIIHPLSISYGETQSIVNLDFADFNNIVEPSTLECLGCVAMGSPDLPLDPFSVPIYLKNLYQIPSDYEYLEVSTVDVVGIIGIAFDGKAYATEYTQVASFGVAGTSVLLTFLTAYDPGEYAQIVSFSVAGQYCDINGVPL